MNYINLNCLKGTYSFNELENKRNFLHDSLDIVESSPPLQLKVSLHYLFTSQVCNLYHLLCILLQDNNGTSNISILYPHVYYPNLLYHNNFLSLNQLYKSTNRK